MGLASVSISGELWQEFVTKGWKPGSIECVEGLPEGAICKKVSYRGWSTTRDSAAPDLIFVFEHPDFDDVELGGAIPEISVVYQRHYPDE